MRVLLRDVRTGLYFRDDESWTPDAEQAQTFRHSAEAMDLARRQSLERAEVILAFQEPRYYSVALPLP